MPSAARSLISHPAAAPHSRSDERAFLPAALEITETPPSPIGRALGATIIAFFCLALAWACWGTVDIVATAPGKIMPSGGTKLVQPLEIGVIRAIHVRDGQRVKAGDVLIELDPTMSDAERRHLGSDLMAAQLDVARLRAALAGGSDPLLDFHPPEGADPASIATERQFLLSQVSEHRAKLSALDGQQAQKEAERATTAAAINKIEAILPVLRQQVEIRKALFEHETGSKVTYLDYLQRLVEAQEDLEVQKSRLREAEAALAAIKETRAQAAEEYRRNLFDELVKAEQKANALAQDLVKAEQRSKFQVLAAPVDGVVQELAVHTVGGVVTPAQPLLVIVPADSRLEIEAMVPNRDIGFVHAGQPVEIKVETFNFTRYGLLHGEVLDLSTDAVARDSPQDPTGDRSPGAESRASGGRAQELAYAARISLDRTQMQIEDRLVSLAPGMAVTVEIKTGSRRVISYLLSPLLRYRGEALRER